MARAPLSEINKQALAPTDEREQPKAMKLFARTAPLEEAPTLEPVTPEPQLEPVPQVVAQKAKPKPQKAKPKARKTAPRKPAAPKEAVTEETDGPMANFFASLPVDTIEALEDAVIRVKRSSGIRSFSRADVVDAMFRLFADIADDLDLDDAPKKSVRSHGPFRTTLKEEVVRVIRKRRAG